MDYKESFLRDLKHINDQALKDRVRETIELVERADTLSQIAHLKKLRSGGRYYRIRLGDYRLGLILDGDTIILVRFLHRKDLYRYFP